MPRGPTIRQYTQKTVPRGTRTPGVRAQSTASNIGQSLLEVGQGLSDVARAGEMRLEADQQIENLRMAREEDDARVYASSAIAQAAGEASRLLREVPMSAADGWRDVTRGVETGLTAYRDNALKAAPNETSRRFLQERFDDLQIRTLDNAATIEQTARRQWRTDTVKSSIDALGNALATDPAGYDTHRAEITTLISGLGDVSADERRGLMDYSEQTLAGSAMAGMVERDPHGALRALRDPEATGAVTQLTGSQRLGLADRAQAEIDRRNARYRSSVVDQINGQKALMEVGLPVENPVPVSTVRSVLGEDAAVAWGVQLEGVRQTGVLAHTSSSDLLKIVSAPPGGDNLGDRLVDQGRRTAAARLLEQRDKDPMQLAVSNGTALAPTEMLEAIQGNDWSAMGPLLRQRAATAGYNASLGMAPSPLTRIEAMEVRSRLDGLPAPDRQRALNLLRSFTVSPNIGNPAMRSAEGDAAYTALARQLYPDSPAAYMGAAVLAKPGAVRGASGQIGSEVASRRLLEGARVLGSVQRGTDDQPRRTFALPADNKLRDTWERNVGDAYAGMPDAEASAFEAYRSYYAGAASEAGEASTDLDGTRARDAIAVATGGITRRNGHATLLPWGTSERAFFDTTERAISAVRERRGGDLAKRSPNSFGYRLIGPGQYVVMNGDVPALDSEGRPVEITMGGR